MRLTHLPSQRQHDVAMRGCDDKLLECGFAFSHGQRPKLPLKYMRQQRVAEQAWRPSQLPLNTPRVEHKHAQIAKGSGWRKVTQGFGNVAHGFIDTVPPRLTWPLLGERAGDIRKNPAHATSREIASAPCRVRVPPDSSPQDVTARLCGENSLAMVSTHEIS